MRAMKRALSLIALVTFAAFCLSACGGDDISEAELERERAFTSYSPTTNKTYTVTCNGDSPTVCTAGIAAVIYIP